MKQNTVYSFGIEFKDGVGSMSDPSYTALGIRKILNDYRANRPYLKGLPLRVEKYVRNDGFRFLCDGRQPKGIRRITI